MQMPAFDPGMSGGEIIDLARDIQVAYGDLAKGFVAAMMRRNALNADPVARDLWLAVADVVWAADPSAKAGCLAELADTIKLH